jgi:uncharacterized protein (PEP-CTERM system associated)
MATTAPTASRRAAGGGKAKRSLRPRSAGLRVAATVGAAMLAGGAHTAAAQQAYFFESGVRTTGLVSSNIDLQPQDDENPGLVLDVSPYFYMSRTGGRLRVSGSGSLGARLEFRQESGNVSSLRPSGDLAATLEAVDNFFFIDGRLNVQRILDNPFLATTDRTSPTNTFTSWQAGLIPYFRGTLLGSFDYEVRSDNSWTDSGQAQGLYQGRHTARIERAPQPIGGALSFERTALESQREGEPRLISDIARFSLRYAPTPQLALGARAGWERYNYTLPPNESRTFFGVEASWRPNERTSFDGYWEDRTFGSSWQLAFSYRRPQMAFNLRSSRDLTNTPQQFLTLPGLASVFAQLDAALRTRIPDPIERQRAIIDIISRAQLPPELLTPTIIYDERITLQTFTNASLVLIGQRNSLALTLFSTRTEGIAGFSSVLPVLADTLERGTELAFNHRLTPITGVTAAASYRKTESLLDADAAATTQTQVRLETSTQLTERTSGTLGARYQWIDSTVTNDAREAAVYFTLNHRF